MKQYKKLLLVLVAVLMFFALSNRTFAQRPRFGMQLGLGGGTFSPVDPAEYFDKTTMLNLDFQLLFDIYAFRFGLTVGYTPLIVTLTVTDGWGTIYSDDYTYVFLPVMADFAIMPLRFFLPNLAFQLFVGGCAGAFNYSVLEVDNSNESQFAIGGKAGFEFYIGEWFVVSLEGRYVRVSEHPDWPGTDLSFFNALLNFRFRIPLIKREF